MSQASQNGSINPESILKSLSIVLEQNNASSLPDSTQGFSIPEAISKAFVDPNIEPEEGAMIASIENISFATLGNFSCIIGKAKSKKTFFITLIIAVFLKGLIDIIQAHKAKGKTRIVWFDTEQSRSHVFKAYKRALKLAGDIFFHTIEVYDLRPYSPAERLQMIDFVLKDKNPDKDIALAVIDGVRDLVTDINNPEQATNIVTWLMKTTADMGLHISTILHQNKGDNNARGHLGTEIVNKSESVISVTKVTKSISVVKAEYCRDKEFSSFAFTVDEQTALPAIVPGYLVMDFEETQTASRINVHITEEQHRSVMQKVFSYQDEYGRTELEVQAKIQYEGAGLPSGNNSVKKSVTQCQNLKIIIKDGSHGSKGKYKLNKQKE